MNKLIKKEDANQLTSIQSFSAKYVICKFIKQHLLELFNMHLLLFQLELQK